MAIRLINPARELVEMNRELFYAARRLPDGDIRLFFSPPGF
jgi:hypothetical protein